MTITGAGDDAPARQADEQNIEVTFKNCPPFTDCISKRNNTQVDNAKDLDVVMTMYNLIEYSDNYSKPWGSLWQYYRFEPVFNNNDSIANRPVNSASFKYKVKITVKIPAGSNTC